MRTSNNDMSSESSPAWMLALPSRKRMSSKYGWECFSKFQMRLCSSKRSQNFSSARSSEMDSRKARVAFMASASRAAVRLQGSARSGDAAHVRPGRNVSPVASSPRRQLGTLLGLLETYIIAMETLPKYCTQRRLVDFGERTPLARRVLLCSLLIAESGG